MSMPFHQYFVFETTTCCSCAQITSLRQRIRTDEYLYPRCWHTTVDVSFEWYLTVDCSTRKKKAGGKSLLDKLKYMSELKLDDGIMDCSQSQTVCGMVPEIGDSLPFCRKHAVANSTKLVNPPDSLIIKLARLEMAATSCRTKFDDRRITNLWVECPLSGMSAASCGFDVPDEQVLYDLTEVLVHKGDTSAAGHYYLNCLCDDGVWRRFDDEKVSVISAPGCELGGAKLHDMIIISEK